MARRPVSKRVDLEDVMASDGVIVDIGRGSVPPPEPVVTGTDAVRAMTAQLEENLNFFEHAHSSRPPAPPSTNLGDVVRRAFPRSEPEGGF